MRLSLLNLHVQRTWQEYLGHTEKSRDGNESHQIDTPGHGPGPAPRTFLDMIFFYFLRHVLSFFFVFTCPYFLCPLFSSDFPCSRIFHPTAFTLFLISSPNTHLIACSTQDFYLSFLFCFLDLVYFFLQPKSVYHGLLFNTLVHKIKNHIDPKKKVSFAVMVLEEERCTGDKKWEVGLN